MPNWYSGTVIIRGDITPFRDWYKDSENELDNSFAQTLAPLSSGEWNFATACDEWGAKWDLSNVNMLSGHDESDGEFSFSFDTPWNSPLYLWRQLELRYGVEVEETGYEEQQLEFYKYHNGRFICKDVDNDWFAENLDFTPSAEALKDEELLEEEKNDFRYEYWCDGMEKWEASLSTDDPDWKNIEMTLVEESRKKEATAQGTT